ncbi:Pvc16 family protein [Streptomyces sp900116325]|uniref:Pvc16 family protein n=1 Tax=Streptomyces sp. 900116325 TaxID=3154295 RepID=UPI0033B20FB0
MSNALAIATVTQALALLIENNLSPEMDIAVKVETRKPPAEPPVEPTINVFLYQVTPNPSMRHTDLPTRASDGTLLKRPVAALDLHFLISAYGEEAELVGQRLIGCVVRTLHEIPVLPTELIELAAERPYLAGSDLVDSPQRLRFTPTVMDIDETSKLWGMLHQTPYALSVAYQASLVLIEGRERPLPVKPVERRTVTVLPFGAPGAPVPPGRQESAEPEPAPESAPEPEAAPDVAPKTAAPARKRAAAKTAKAATKPVTKRAAPARARKGTEAGADDKES